MEEPAKRVRRGTPDDAEEYEITPETTKMGDLCDDNKRGKKSETEREMAANWDEILRRRREDAEMRMAASTARSRRKKDRDRTNTENGGADDDGDGESNGGRGGGDSTVVGLQIENGQIVVASRELDRRGRLDEMVQETNPADVREDKDIYKRVLATTVGVRNTSAPGGQNWDDLSTELFYTGLKQFGTDFQMISAMIPNKTRKQVKLKYNIEERKNWIRVKRCLGMKEEVDLDEYAQATGVTFASVSDVYKQMEEDEKRLRDEDEQRRREEGIISQDREGSQEADVALPSIEDGGTGDVDGEENAGADNDTSIPPGQSGDPGGGARARERQSTAASRLGSTTTTTRQTAQPTTGTKRKQQEKNKGSAASNKKTRQAANRNKGLEGVEERIGDIDDVAMPMGGMAR